MSWSAATDKENNLEGYVVERSVDGGGTWVQVYQGSATKTTNTIPAGSATVMYRVKAYDSEGLYSNYRNSVQVSVFNNAAPNVPGGITLPVEVLGGGKLTIAWGAASDPDNNLTGYELERQIDGGDWAQIYKGADTSYTDTITRGWQSVNYPKRTSGMVVSRITPPWDNSSLGGSSFVGDCSSWITGGSFVLGRDGFIGIDGRIISSAGSFGTTGKAGSIVSGSVGATGIRGRPACHHFCDTQQRLSVCGMAAKRQDSQHRSKLHVCGKSRSNIYRYF